MRRNWFSCLVLITLAFFPQCKLLQKPPAKVLTGLDVLIKSDFADIKGKRVGLVTNHTAIAKDGRHIADILHRAEGVALVALYSPEHGIRGKKEGGELLSQETDSSTGVPIYSLYGETKKPTHEMLKGVEVLLFDIQDVGARFYTYISTLSLAMEAAAENSVPFIVLDRPNPIGGQMVEGPLLQKEFKSFVGIHEIALRHGLTNGELAKMFNEEGWLQDSVKADLKVIKMQGWRRSDFFQETGLTWIKPSPNMTDPQTAIVYPGMGLLEASNISEGRGTPTPFLTVGAPWIEAEKLREQLLVQKVRDIEIDTVSYVPVDLPGTAMNPKYEGQRCYGLKLKVNDPHSFPAVEFGIRLLCAVRQLYPEKFVMNEGGMNLLSGDGEIYASIKRGAPADSIIAHCRQSVEKFVLLRQKYLLYN